MSEIAGTLSLAATRGMRDFAAEDVVETTCVKGEDSVRSFSNKGERTSGTGAEYCGEVECRTESSPFSLMTCRLDCLNAVSTRTFWLVPRCLGPGLVHQRREPKFFLRAVGQRSRPREIPSQGHPGGVQGRRVHGERRLASRRREQKLCGSGHTCCEAWQGESRKMEMQKNKLRSG